LLLGLSAAGLFYAFTRPTDNQQPALRDVAVRHVEPAPGDRVLRQTDVAIDLAAGYTAVLYIDDRRLPEDQLDRIVGLNRVSFTPGEGKDITELSAGHHCAKAELWQITIDDAPHRFYSWCFDAH
jgi:hypothetical protein